MGLLDFIFGNRKHKEELERLAEEKRKMEEEMRRVEEEKRKAVEEAARLAEEKRLAEEEAKRVAEEKRKAEEAARIAEEKRLAEEEAKRKAAEETARLVEEKRRLEEEAKRLEEEKRLVEEKRKMEEGAKRKAEEEAKHRGQDVLFDGLNDNQKEAIKETEGRVRVVAGAGSGKTKVLAHRFAYLVNTYGIDPANMLCLTFTNKAAQEMKNRIAKLVASYNVNEYVCTIHGFCVKFLRKEIYRIGYPANFQIIDEEDSKDFAKQVMEEVGLDRTATTNKQFLRGIGLSKNRICPRYVDDYLIPGYQLKEEDKNDEFILYLMLQRKYFALDFNDLIHFTLYILDNFPKVRDEWAKKFNYIEVDEVQDCNGSDWAIIDALSSYYNNLFIVGDPDQAIYEWRGARPKVFVDFAADKTIILDENYRSTPNILNVANSIISHNTMRIEKNLVTKKESGKVAIHKHAKSEQEEGKWIADQIENIIKAGAENSDIAILYRASYLSRYVEQALLNKGLKYTIWGGIRFFERKEIKDCIAYLKVIAMDDDMSFKRIINEPSRKFGKVTLSKLVDLSNDEKRPLYQTLKSHINDKAFNKESFKEFIELIEDAKGKSLSMSIPDLMDYVLVNSGLQELYRMKDDEDRLENVSELINSMKLYMVTNGNEDVSLENYLQDIALYTNADYKNEGSTIKLMTIHQAKGLEFPYVFIVGLTEGIFPSQKSILERKKNGEEEERRLMYVAITRAEKIVFLTESEGYNFTTKRDKYPSRFLLEISDGLINVEGDVDPQLFEGTKNLVDEINKSYTDEEMYFNVGDKVEHPIMGKGVVTEVREHGNTYIVTFDFGERAINGKYLTLVEGNKEVQHPVANKTYNFNSSRAEVNDVLNLSSGVSIIYDIDDEGIKVFNIQRKSLYILRKDEFFVIAFRPKKDCFYRYMRPSLKGEEKFFYVKDFIPTINGIHLYGIGNNIEVDGLLNVNYEDISECNEEWFINHCSDVARFEKLRNKDYSSLIGEEMTIPRYLKEFKLEPIRNEMQQTPTKALFTPTTDFSNMDCVYSEEYGVGRYFAWQKGESIYFYGSNKSVQLSELNDIKRIYSIKYCSYYEYKTDSSVRCLYLIGEIRLSNGNNLMFIDINGKGFILPSKDSYGLVGSQAAVFNKQKDPTVKPKQLAREMFVLEKFFDEQTLKDNIESIEENRDVVTQEIDGNKVHYKIANSDQISQIAFVPGTRFYLGYRIRKWCTVIKCEDERIICKTESGDLSIHKDRIKNEFYTSIRR